MVLKTTSIASLNDIIGGRAEEFERHPISDVLLGFDAVVQFSRRLLEVQIESSLARLGLSPLAADVPWGTLPVPQALLTKLSNTFVNTLPFRETRLELRLVNPQIESMSWPAQDAAVDPLPVDSTLAAAGPSRRVVKVAWRLELSVLTARFDQATEIAPVASPPTSRPSSPFGNVDLDLTVTTDVGAAPDSSRSWTRSTFAAGKAVLEADALLVSEPRRWRFGMELDFTDVAPSVTSDEPALVEFLAGAGQTLLARAVAPLADAEVLLTPQVAPAGPLSSRSVQRIGLPGFQVVDRILTSREGHPILCLCLQLDGRSGGVARLVKPFLEVSDFGYAVSISILKPALKIRWRKFATGVSLAGEVPVEMPAGDDPTDSETCRAQVLSHFADTLDDVTILSSVSPKGDALALLGRQTVQLLNLWRENGDRIPELGELGRPAEVPLALLLSLLSRSGPSSIRQELQNLLLKLLPVVVGPLLQGFAARNGSLTGFISGPLKTTFARWRLKPIQGDVAINPNNPATGTLSWQV
jgi:hypothetical protein